jgi:hypothetical protein
MSIPCKLFVVPKPNFVQTVVIKFAADASAECLQSWAREQGIHGAGAFAFVEISPVPGLDTSQARFVGLELEVYLVLTLPEPCYFPSRAAKIKQSLLKYPMSPGVEWVKPLDRRLQRLLGWGDVCCTEADVAKAVKERDVGELLALTPWAKALVPSFFDDASREEESSVTIHDVPRVFTVLQSGMLQLEDCQHEFFTELEFHQFGPCSRGTPETVHTHRMPYTRCTKCRLVLCNRCAGLEQDAQREERNVRKWATKASQNPPCFWQHPQSPKPFFVFDHTKLADSEKLLWIRHEVGEEVDLPSFARAFLTHFGDKLHGAVPQKSKVLQLYMQYNENAGISWLCERDMPPQDRELFQKVWTASAPNLCWECGKALTESAELAHGHYCNMACQEARFLVKCVRCESTLQADARGYYHCGCAQAPLAERLQPPHLGGQFTRLDQMLRHSATALKFVEEMFFTGAATSRIPNPDHEPAWKRPRRS